MAACAGTAAVVDVAYKASAQAEGLGSMPLSRCPIAVPARYSSLHLLLQAEPPVMAADRMEARDTNYFVRPEYCP